MMKNTILCIAISLFCTACTNDKQKNTQEVVDPEIICGFASRYAVENLKGRFDDVPKSLVVAMEKLAYYTDGKNQPVLHEKMQQAIDFAYEQDIPEDHIQKNEFIE